MKCIYCDKKTLVKNTTTTSKTVIRERQCKSCNKTFYTEETVPETVKQEALKNQLNFHRQYRKDELKGLI